MPVKDVMKNVRHVMKFAPREMGWTVGMTTNRINII